MNHRTGPVAAAFDGHQPIYRQIAEQIRDDVVDGALLEEEQVAVLPGESFGPAATGHIRISMCETEARLQEAATRLAAFVQRRLGGQRASM